MNRLFDKTGSYLLILPLLAFVAVFFLWPLFTVMSQAISDPLMARNFPHTAQALADWDGNEKPSRAAEIALIDDLRAVGDARTMGDIVRKLNSNQAGFRSVMSKTLTELGTGPDHPLLADIDKRWDSPAYWRALHKALPRFTDQHILAAVDMRRDSEGRIVSQPESQSANRANMLRTLWISFVVVVFCIAIGLPYAMIMASSAGWVRNVLLAAVMIPLWTSLLVRTSAWYVLLQDTGIINSAIMWLGLTEQPLRLLFARTGVIIAMVHVLLPFMVLPVYGVLLSIPRNLMPAAGSLGATPLRAFWHVLLPLSARGVASGSLLVFISAIGYYITPALIGGAGDQMISSVIAFYALNSANWSMSSALSVVLLLATLTLYAIYSRVAVNNPR